MHDLIIIGAGPAGLTAAIYALRAGKSVLLLEKDGPGGQMTSSPKIENYPGIPAVSGAALADQMLEQALNLGAELELEQAQQILDGNPKTVVTDRAKHQATAVIIATGASHRLLGVPGEDRFLGDGISFCAVCDGAFYAGKDVVVVGGGNSALQEAVLLSELCRSVTILQDLDFLTGEQLLVRQLETAANVKIITGTAVKEFTGDDALTGVEAVLKKDGSSLSLKCDGVFLAVGLIPESELAAGIAELTESKYFDSDERCLTRTSGVFVAGDCRAKGLRQVSTATADGAVSAIASCRYIDGLKA